MGIKGQIREYSETREQRKYKENKEYWENIQDRVNWENNKYSELTWFRDIENLRKITIIRREREYLKNIETGLGKQR